MIMTSSKKIFLIASHPIVNVPPFFNSSKELAQHGYQVFLIGYYKDGLKPVEKMETNAYIFRIKLWSHWIKISFLRKLVSLVEFIFITFKIVRNKKPDAIIVFNDPTTILLRFFSKNQSITKVNWLLEFPEFNRINFFEKMLFGFSTSCWQFSDVMVLPTNERLALSLCLQPNCLNKVSCIIHNTPRSELLAKHISQYSTNAQCAIKFLTSEKARGNITIVYAGAIGNRYAIDQLIYSIGNIESRISLLLLGKKHDLSIQEVNLALERTSGSNQNILWADEVHYDELSKVLSYADIGFAVYLGDSLNTKFSAPGKIYEYLKAGLAILTDYKCCIVSEISAYNCGIIIPQESQNNHVLKDVIFNEILDQHQKINDMKFQSKNLYQDLFDFSQQFKPLVSLLENTKPT